MQHVTTETGTENWDSFDNLETLKNMNLLNKSVFVTEKLNGVNFGVHVNENGCSLQGSMEKFATVNNYMSIVPKCYEFAQTISRILNTLTINPIKKTEIIVYGELMDGPLWFPFGVKTRSTTGRWETLLCSENMYNFFVMMMTGPIRQIRKLYNGPLGDGLEQLSDFLLTTETKGCVICANDNSFCYQWKSPKFEEQIKISKHKGDQWKFVEKVFNESKHYVKKIVMSKRLKKHAL